MGLLKQVQITRIHQGIISGRVETTLFRRSFALSLKVMTAHRLRIRLLQSPLPLHGWLVGLWRVWGGSFPPGITLVGEHIDVNLTMLLQRLPLTSATMGEDQLMAQTILTQLLANGFADLKGLDITFRIPLPQALLNTLLAEMLRQDGKPRQAAPTTTLNASAAATPRLDASAVLGLVKTAAIKAETGTLILEGRLQR